MTDKHRDTSLKDEKLSELYRQTEQTEPSAQLDALIQSAARDAVKSPDSRASAEPASWQQKQSWFALAATIALVAIVLPFMLNESDQILSEPDLLPSRQAPGKMLEQDSKSSLFDDGATAPAMTVAPELAPSPATIPLPTLAKPAPEKKSLRKIPEPMPSETTLQRERLEHRALPLKQKTDSNQAGQLKTEQETIQQPELGSLADQLPRSAQAWQQQIWQLVQEQQLAMARTELQALQKAWPDFQVDPDLLSQTGTLSEPLPNPATQN